MSKTQTPPPPDGLEPYHESTHTRTAVNTDAAGGRVLDVESSVLVMHWHAGELRLQHRLANVSRQAMRRPPLRNERSKRHRL